MHLLVEELLTGSGNSMVLLEEDKLMKLIGQHNFLGGGAKQSFWR